MTEPPAGGYSPRLTREAGVHTLRYPRYRGQRRPRPRTACVAETYMSGFLRSCSTVCPRHGPVRAGVVGLVLCFIAVHGGWSAAAQTVTATTGGVHGVRPPRDHRRESQRGRRHSRRRGERVARTTTSPTSGPSRRLRSRLLDTRRRWPVPGTLSQYRQQVRRQRVSRRRSTRISRTTRWKRPTSTATRSRAGCPAGRASTCAT